MEISYITLLFSLAMPIAVIILIYMQNTSFSRRIIKSSILMIVQLVCSAIILTFVFANSHILIILIYMLSMLLFSLRTIKVSIDNNSKFLKYTFVAVSVSTIIVIVYITIILRISNEVISARQIIPLFGMLLGNTTTATILACNEFENTLTNKKEYILTLMNLGVKAKQAVNEQFKRVVVIALTPILASMLNIGVVTLPGMMSGQIIAGQQPINAIMYQILIMFGILFSITISVLLLKSIVLRTIVNKNNQITLWKDY